MSPPPEVRWTVRVSAETDRALREYLGRRGARKGALSRFVDDAVQDRLRGADAAEAHGERVRDAELKPVVLEALRWARGEIRDA